MGKLEEGKAALTKAAELDPANGGKYYFNLGAVMVNSNNTEGAIEAFKKATGSGSQVRRGLLSAWHGYGGQSRSEGRRLDRSGSGHRRSLQEIRRVVADRTQCRGRQEHDRVSDGTVSTAFENKGKKKKHGVTAGWLRSEVSFSHRQGRRGILDALLSCSHVSNPIFYPRAGVWALDADAPGDLDRARSVQALLGLARDPSKGGPARRPRPRQPNRRPPAILCATPSRAPTSIRTWPSNRHRRPDATISSPNNARRFLRRHEPNVRTRIMPVVRCEARLKSAPATSRRFRPRLSG